MMLAAANADAGGPDLRWTELALLGPGGEVLARERWTGSHQEELLPVVAARFDRGPVDLGTRVLHPRDWLLPSLRGSRQKALGALRAAGAEVEQSDGVVIARFRAQGRHWTPLFAMLAFAGIAFVTGPIGWAVGALLLGFTLFALPGLRTLVRPLWSGSHELVTLTLDQDRLRVVRELTGMPTTEQSLARPDLLAFLPEGKAVTRDHQPIPAVHSLLQSRGRARWPAVAELLRAEWGQPG